jgi:prepilin-type N-terminal cleavage/methylation domain-containing protein
MTLNPARHRQGFTLIEMVVYVALLSLLVGGTLLTVYNLLTDVGTMRGKVNTDEEANFMLRKIDWALAGATYGGVTNPTPGNSSAFLQVNKGGFAENPIRIDLASSTMQLSRAGDAQPISSSNVTVADLNFQRYAVASSSQVIRTTFKLNGRTFELVKYLYP